MISTHFENISVGDTTTTESRTITNEYVRDFAELTWDRHPLHLNPEYAQQTRFGRQIAHGALMLSTLLGLVELHPSYLQCFYGLDDVRFHAPTFFGDTVHAASEVVAVRPRQDGQTAVVTCRGALINQAGTLVVSGLFSLLVAGKDQAIEMEAAAQ
ncbi:MaoC family dehydratase [Rhodococcus sp. NPDC057529]|uniref:MaoC family dehydratase n=1 Tax=Rhodococcus sp. NPDC057529 TaxID=3346158 RepID=UPI00366AB21F